MDGRRFRLWLCGGLLVGATATGCTRQQTVPGGVSLPSPGQPMGQKKSHSFFSKDNASPAAPEPVNTTKRTGEKKEWSADSMVAFADLRAQVALSEERAPADREQLVDSARQAYQAALKKDPKNKGAMLGLAKLYSAIGGLDRADDMYRRYLLVSPKDHAVAHEVAMAHARAKDWNGAVSWCQQALQTDPENRVYRKTMGFCLTHAGRWDEGFAALCQVMPEAQARYSMAKALAHLNQPEMSKQQLTLAIQVDPTFIPAREFLAEMQSPTPRVVEESGNVRAVEYQQPAPGP